MIIATNIARVWVSACLAQDSELYKNGRTDRHAVWTTGPRERNT